MSLRDALKQSLLDKQARESNGPIAPKSLA